MFTIAAAFVITFVSAVTSAADYRLGFWAAAADAAAAVATAAAAYRLGYWAAAATGVEVVVAGAAASAVEK